jgi:hypothetical protein
MLSFQPSRDYPLRKNVRMLDYPLRKNVRYVRLLYFPYDHSISTNLSSLYDFWRVYNIAVKCQRSFC